MKKKRTLDSETDEELDAKDETIFVLRDYIKSLKDDKESLKADKLILNSRIERLESQLGE
jgi:hypothetical protein